MSKIPTGFKEIKEVTGVYVSKHEIVVTGHPETDDEEHNCDELGCTSVSHVLFREKRENERKI